MDRYFWTSSWSNDAECKQELCCYTASVFHWQFTIPLCCLEIHGVKVTEGSMYKRRTSWSCLRRTIHTLESIIFCTLSDMTWVLVWEGTNSFFSVGRWSAHFGQHIQNIRNVDVKSFSWLWRWYEEKVFKQERNTVITVEEWRLCGHGVTILLRRRD